ncbi:lysozyme [Sphingomonas sp. CBMAI 2297]|uniref:lysozyme n=1 Tax=Sphingomonas sp. CBMAI 2297 TaxID=2991720 RepID=UPI002458D86F|nr:lysozyme [Sphingomonas sp. CBMAI 2297]MDH4745807.1 lysozyme [Sphingomonas sp. CBMAI 2297]
MPNPTNSASPPARPGRKTLASVVGLITAGLLFNSIPREESGRKVDAKVEATTGTATIKHISGPQYLRAYLDIVGVATACDGLTGPEIDAARRAGKTFTEQQCTVMLEDALVSHAEAVLACTPSLRLARPGRDYQRFAAVSLAYNVGAGPRGWCGSSARRLFEAGQWAVGCDAFKLWRKAGGKVIPGLVRRRAREWEGCVTNILPGKTPANYAARVAGAR